MSELKIDPNIETFNDGESLKSLAKSIAEKANSDGVKAEDTYPKADEPAVIIAPPRKKEQKVNPAEAQVAAMDDQIQKNLMDTEAPVAKPKPVPVAVGLSEESLKTENYVNARPTTGEGAGKYTNVINYVGFLNEKQRELIKEYAPNIPEDQFVEKIIPLFTRTPDTLRQLFLTSQMDQDKAEEYVYNEIVADLKKADAEYVEKNASTAQVVIDKTQDANDLGLTAEEHEKLERAKRIRLVLVEDKDLANIKIAKTPEEHKADYIRSIGGSISNYSVPLPMFGDFVTFRGAQILQLINAVTFDDARLHEILNTQASLIYDKLVGGSILKRYDDDGRSIMSYEEFINKFPQSDVDMAIYGIVCASSMEETNVDLKCNNCNHSWSRKYNLKNLLNLNNISDKFKARVDSIIANKNNAEAMLNIQKEMDRVFRYKSPFSGNIYDLSYPTIARSINIMRRVNEDDMMQVYTTTAAIYLRRVLIYDSTHDNYVEVSSTEPDLLLEVVHSLSNEDMTMLVQQIQQEMMYTPQFVLDGTCPSCHQQINQPIPISQLVFLLARDSMAEIEL